MGFMLSTKLLGEALISSMSLRTTVERGLKPSWARLSAVYREILMSLGQKLDDTTPTSSISLLNELLNLSRSLCSDLVSNI